MSKETGGPAFPSNYHEKGMSLRDWFAGKALQGLITAGGYPKDAAVEWAYNYADAMLKARMK